MGYSAQLLTIGLIAGNLMVAPDPAKSDPVSNISIACHNPPGEVMHPTLAQSSDPAVKFPSAANFDIQMEINAKTAGPGSVLVNATNDGVCEVDSQPDILLAPSGGSGGFNSDCGVIPIFSSIPDSSDQDGVHHYEIYIRPTSDNWVGTCTARFTIAFRFLNGRAR